MGEGNRTGGDKILTLRGRGVGFALIIVMRKGYWDRAVRVAVGFVVPRRIWRGSGLVLSLDRGDRRRRAEI